MIKTQNFERRSKTEFSVKAWLLRLLSLIIAFGSVVYFIQDHNKRNELKLKNQELRKSSGRHLTIPVYRSQR